jgi:hypothetical protein
MKNWILLLAVAGIAILPLSMLAQGNSHLPASRNGQPHPQTLPSSNEPYTILDYRISRDFNISKGDKNPQMGWSHYRTIYKKIRINTKAGADSLTRLVMGFDANEGLRGLRIRVIKPGGETVDLNNEVRMIDLNDDNKAIIVNNLALEQGSQVEYELSLKVRYDYSGNDFLQSEIPCNQVSFTLIAPKTLTFRFKSSHGVPPLKDSTAGEIRYYQLHMNHLPAYPNNSLYYVLPQLKRIDFALQQAVEGKDTTRMNWQQFAENNYIPLVAVSKAEYKQLEKEIQKWPFVKYRLPVPQMIYLVEQYIKSNYQLVPSMETGETADISTILRSGRADKIGMTRLLNAAYYILNIPTQVLFTSSRDNLPIDSQLINYQLPKHTLLYFPTVQQSLAPTDMDTRFPCYPPLWSGLTAIRCRDTLVNEQSRVLTDFIETPVPTYTLSNITLDATLKSVSDPVWEVKQSFGGFPACNVKDAFGKAGGATEAKFRIYNSLLPFEPAMRKPVNVTTQNEVFNNQTLDKPVILNSTLNTPSLVENKNNSMVFHLGQLLGGTMPVDMPLPPADLPVQITFPYYQEKRIHITIPDGYKVANKEDFSADITDGNSPSIGFKIRCEQNGNQLTIFTLEWYRQENYTGSAKATFGKMLKRLQILQLQDLILVKQ